MSKGKSIRRYLSFFVMMCWISTMDEGCAKVEQWNAQQVASRTDAAPSALVMPWR